MKTLLLFISLFSTFSVSGQEETKEVEDKGYIIHSIYFGGGSNLIDDTQAAELFRLLDSIPNLEMHTMTIHSHTDNIGGKEYNEWLSQKRSEMTIEKLVEGGVLFETIGQKDFGQLNPVYNNSTFVGRLRNRRVDIIIWSPAL